MTFTKDIEEQEGLVRRLRTQQEKEMKRLEEIHNHYDAVTTRLHEELNRLHTMREAS